MVKCDWTTYIIFLGTSLGQIFFRRFAVFANLSLFFSALCSPLKGEGADLFCLRSWTKGNDLALAGKYQMAIASFDEALLRHPECSYRYLIAVDKAVCLERLGKFHEALDLYSPIGRSVFWHPLETKHILALQGAVRCKVVLGQDYSSEQKILNRWHNHSPNSYLLGDIWAIVPYSQDSFCAKSEILTIFTQAFDISLQDAQGLYFSICVVEDSGLVLLSLEEAKEFLCCISRAHAKKISLDFLKNAAQNHALSQKSTLPTIGTRVVSPEPVILAISETTPDWMISWFRLYKPRKGFLVPIGPPPKLTEIIAKISPLTPFQELRTRIFLECGIKAQREENLAKARQFFLSVVRDAGTFPTRTSLSAVSRAFFVAMQQRDISLMLKLMLRMRKVYLPIPRIVSHEGTDLVVSCPSYNKILDLRDWIVESSFQIAEWNSAPKKISVSISGGALFWPSFEESIVVNAPGLRLFVTLLKKEKGYGIFSKPNSGWFVPSFLQEHRYDDV